MFEIEQLGSGIDEGRAVARVGEIWMPQQLLKKAQVGDHAAHAKLAQRAQHPRRRFLGRGAPRGHFDQQRIVVARDLRAGIRGAGIEPHAETG